VSGVVGHIGARHLDNPTCMRRGESADQLESVSFSVYGGRIAIGCWGKY